MIGRAEIAQADMRLGVQPLLQCYSEPRLAHAGFAGDQHDLAGAPWRAPSDATTVRSPRREAPCNASNRLATALGRSTCHAHTGPAIPLTSTAPSSRYSKRSPRSRRVLGPITTALGLARACNRAARF